MLTSSIAWMGWTLSFLSAVCSFLSSVPDDLWTFLVLRRGVPLPLYCGKVCQRERSSSEERSRVRLLVQATLGFAEVNAGGGYRVVDEMEKKHTLIQKVSKVHLGKAGALLGSSTTVL
jgi:hypothetical protein